ncbi:MAG: hypothetical protein HYZ37_11785 [Candidatus Solibacter usitatus]|nr:hypothetical protein [Candidatus Solibacter usitatus]
MKIGAERNKVIALAVLLLVAAYSIYTNVLSDSTPPAASQPTVKPAAAVVSLPQPPSASERQADQRSQQRKQFFAGRQSVGEYRPILKAARPEDRPDPMKVDPTLRLDILAKLQTVTLQGGQRTLFDFGLPPAPKPVKPDPKIQVGPKKPDPGGAVAEVKPAAPVKPADPPKPPIPLKFFGYTAPKTGGLKRAFFLEGEDIHVGREGDLIKSRYKVVRIGVNSVVMEDTQYKNEQTLPLEEPPVNG